jgi:hypothetical protein
MLPSSRAPPTCPPPSPTTQNTEGGGVWAEHLRWAAPDARERRPLFLWGGVYVLVPIWLGAPRPAWPPKSLIEEGASRIFGEVPKAVECVVTVFDYGLSNSML